MTESAEGTMSDAVTHAVAGSHRWGAGRRALLASMVLAASACALPARGDSPRPEDLEPVVKAEFIARFTDYIDWPRNAFAADSAFHFCAVGNGPLIPHIRNLISNIRLKNRPVAYRALADTSGAAGCHLIYFAPDAGNDMDRIIQRLDDAPVLTIGDTPGYGKKGAMINLFLEGTRVRFKINSNAAKANGLQVSAKLLVLGKPITAGE